MSTGCSPTDNLRALIGDTIVQTSRLQEGKEQFFPNGQILNRLDEARVTGG